jgi:transposase
MVGGGSPLGSANKPLLPPTHPNKEIRMENETIESVVNTTETQLQNKIKERRTKKKRIDVAEVLKEIEAGTSLKELANRFNVSYCAFYNYKELKEALKSRKTAKKTALLQQVNELLDQGLNFKEIAARLNISLVTLRKFIDNKQKRKKNKQDDQNQPTNETKNEEIVPEDSPPLIIPAPAKPEEIKDGTYQ